MSLLRQLWQDDAGSILSAEAVLLGTVGIAGATVGLGAASKAIDDELTEVAYALRSLDQSYCIEGMSGCGARTAGSRYSQPAIKESHAELTEWIERQRSDTSRQEELHQQDDDALRQQFEQHRLEHEQRLRQRADEAQRRKQQERQKQRMEQHKQEPKKDQQRKKREHDTKHPNDDKQQHSE